MSRLKLYSEPYGASGNIGSSFRKLLGAPTLDPAHIMLREAVQNSCDAARLGNGPEILVRLRDLNPEQTVVLREQVLAELPPESTGFPRFGFLEAEQPPRVIEICDFATTGLGGPTRADRVPVGAQTRDFINFLRNVGIERDTAQGGGTYGFGKSALYRVSRCSTILVDTVAHGEAGDAARRFMGCHVGKSFNVVQDGMLKGFTGRHWWGVPEGGDDSEAPFVEPLLGAPAARIAQGLGLPGRNPGRTGTSIMILDYDHHGDLRTHGQHLAEAILWNFWPRMMRDVPDDRRFRIRIEVQGEALNLPEPEDCPPLNLFCNAMRDLRNGSGHDVRDIRCGNPKAMLGRLAFRRGIRAGRERLVPPCASLMPDPCHHVALMRPVELVVKYISGSPIEGDGGEWAGVFLVSDEEPIEAAFAAAEPPAHDDWVSSNLEERRARTFVNVALRKIGEAARAYGLPPERTELPGGSGLPLAAAASAMGSLLGDGSGQGARSKVRSRRVNGGAARQARASMPRFVRLEDRSGIVAVFETEVVQDRAGSGQVLRAEAALAVDGGSSRAVPAGMAPPIIIAIRGLDFDLGVEGPIFPLEGRAGRFEISVRIPPEASVQVSVALEGGEAQ